MIILNLLVMVYYFKICLRFMMSTQVFMMESLRPVVKQTSRPSPCVRRGTGRNNNITDLLFRYGTVFQGIVAI